MGWKQPPCDITLEFATSSPLTAQQEALYQAVRKLVGDFDHHVSLRAYALSGGKGKMPLAPVKQEVVKKKPTRRRK
jgi:hypothetical protein